jgi:hypothetical protein
MRLRARSVLALGVLFAGGAAASFAVARPTLASAAARAVPAAACQSASGNFTCGVPTGSDFNDGTFSRFYFDFYPLAGQNVQLVATKTSTAGSYYQDYLLVGAATMTPGVPNERSVTAVNTKLVPSSWDYVVLYMLGTNGALGVGILTN